MVEVDVELHPILLPQQLSMLHISNVTITSTIKATTRSDKRHLRYGIGSKQHALFSAALSITCCSAAALRSGFLNGPLMMLTLTLASRQQPNGPISQTAACMLA
jgi:hypothetical protein